jgi:hypothetical protein
LRSEEAMNETGATNQTSSETSRRSEPFATFGVLAAVLAAAASEGVLNAELFTRADFDWSGKITLRLGIGDGTEAAVAMLAQRLGLSESSRTTRSRDPLYRADRTDLVWVEVVYTGRYAGHDVDLSGAWVAERPGGQGEDGASS